MRPEHPPPAKISCWVLAPTDEMETNNTAKAARVSRDARLSCMLLLIGLLLVARFVCVAQVQKRCCAAVDAT